MAKDGTRRGGRRVRAGDKPKALSDKIAEGKDADIMEFHAPELDAADLDDAADLTGADMPSPSAYLSAQQKNGKPLGADIVYKETWLWLKQRGCEKHVNKRLLESYSQAFARFVQCEEALSTYGLLGNHPTTGGVKKQKTKKKAPDHRRRYCFPVCADEPDISETGKFALV